MCVSGVIEKEEERAGYIILIHAPPFAASLNFEPNSINRFGYTLFVNLWNYHWLKKICFSYFHWLIL